MTIPLIEKYADEIVGMVSCYDRLILSGNVQEICYPHGMTSYLYQNKIRIFDYGKQFADPLRKKIRANAERVATEAGLQIEFIGQPKAFRKEDRIKQIIEERGEEAGLVHIFSAMEACQAYKPWYEEPTRKKYVKRTSGKCLHYYFYFIDEEFGLCYLRVPTWCPFRLQFYCNGHNRLATQLRAKQIEFTQADNTFLHISDCERANQLASTLDIEQWHAQLNRWAEMYCPVIKELDLTIHWSILQAEYATDLIFKNQATLKAFMPRLMESLVLAVKPADIATFFGRKLHGNYQDEQGSRYNKRWWGQRIKHRMGPVSVKMYDKFNTVLRIETTINKVGFFKQYREVHHRDGSVSTQYAPMKKTMYSLPPLAEQALAVNKRYLNFISAIESDEVGVERVQQLAETQSDDKGRRYKGFNLLAEEDASFFRLLSDGSFLIVGFSNKALRQHLPHKSVGQISRLLRRLRAHGLIKRVQRSYRYYLTTFGRTVVTSALKLRELVVIPLLASNPA